ncbi:hypothetical protein [Escherichia phage E20-1]|nr:hypothetical protein [Escherichia phage E20-1]
MNQAVFGVNTIFKVFSLSSLIFKERSTSLCVLLSVFLPLPVEAFYRDANHLSRSFYYLLLLTAYYGIHITIQENPVNTLFSNYFISHCFIKEFILGRIGTTKKSGGKGTCTRDTSQEMACKAIISVL